MNIVYLGNEEVVMIQVPRGFHSLAAVHGVDLQDIALKAVVERLRAVSLADHMSRSIQMKFGQARLNAE